MPYVKKTIIAGNAITVRKYFSSRWNSESKGVAQKTERTSEAQEAINEKNAIWKLTALLNTNFVPGDLNVLFTYGADKLPKSREEAKENLLKLKRAMRKAYKSAGVEFKYISVVEHPDSNLHHHFVVSEIDIRYLKDVWPHGRVFFEPLYTATYERLAEYMIKETKTNFRENGISRKRWESSRNLKKPEITVEVVNSDSWQEEPIVPNGYYLKRGSYFVGVTDEGYAYQEYTVIKYKKIPKGKKTWRRI